MKLAWRHVGIALLVLVPALPRAHAAPAKPRLDRKKVQALAMRWMEARPRTCFEAWDPGVRRALLDEAAALGPLPEGSREPVLELLWKAVKKHGPRSQTIDGKTAIPTPYGPAWWIESGSGGRKAGLVLGLHGGGEGAGSASEAAGKWKLPKTMAMYPQGIRLIHDTWNSVHGERFLLTLIEIAKAQHEVDPDRVYAMGFSMGGVGSMFMSGRHPDLFAGAIPAHGVVSAQGGTKIVKEEDVGDMEHGLLPNLRNVAVYFYTGTLDKNCEPGTFCKAWTLIQALRKGDPEGYADIRFQCHEGIAHSFPPGEPGKGFQFIEDKRRDAYPRKVVWEYNNDPWIYPEAEDEGKATRRPKHWMYWLHCARPEDRMLVTATRRDEEGVLAIDLQVGKVAFPDDFTIYLNEKMVTPSQDVVLRVNGKEVYRGRPQPDLVSILESFDAKLDRTLTFDRRIRVPEVR